MIDEIDPEAARAIAKEVAPGGALIPIGRGHHSLAFRAEAGSGHDSTGVVRVRLSPSASFPWRFYTALLQEGAPLVRYARPPCNQDGYEVAVMEYLKPGPVAQPNHIRLLEKLHAAPVAPREAPTWDWFDRTAAALSKVHGDHARSLGKALNRVGATLSRIGVGRVSALHGDPHPDNIGVAGDGVERWFDLDDLCVGPVAWDWSSLIFMARRFEGEGPALEAILQAAAEDCGGPASSAVLDQMVILREIGLLISGYRLLEQRHHPELAYRVRTLQEGDTYARWTVIDDL